ncbi:carboxypeptidase-like regulatory domain-containing protein [Flammeovirga aprica]|uniref:Carboxypeptidase-like regulatory domain-containing protein n=1 Tax=Flammeovirga aprica JL-4 TaxID=694437 RepID=A0A7X9P164_9BACT|nr:carboxypeptidase-like regulatory domain-containing protein [Flammeovirga aprica]NME67661.1 carboxypeptidase-like regulatory domain-containing protein [Flammeovirga aprica JL-4]
MIQFFGKILNIKAILFLGIVAFFLQPNDILAQGEQNTIQFSGIVVEGDSSYGVPGAHVYIKQAGRGTVTNHAGFFTMPTQVGDTIVVSSVGFAKQEIVIPKRDDLGFTVLIEMREEVTELPLLEVFPYPTKEIFEEAFLALGEQKDQRVENMEKNLSQEKLTMMSNALPMGASGNYKYYMNYRADQIATQYFMETANPLLNPFAWGDLIKSIKRGDFKRKD